MDREALSTFHQRQGDQILLNSERNAPSTWMRVYGNRYERGTRQTIEGIHFDIGSEFDGDISGIQIGQSLYGRINDDDSRDLVGLIFSHTEAKGDVEGYTLGRAHNDSGNLDLDSYSFGAYWTHIGADGWYLDGTLMTSWVDGEAESNRGIGADIEGTTYLASLEAGNPIRLNDAWTIEPQAQIIWQKGNLDETQDRFSSIDYGNASTHTGRLGLRTENVTQLNRATIQPYIDLNLWHDFSTTEKVTFNGRDVDMHYRGNVLEIGAGVAAKLTPEFSIYAAINSGSNLDEEHAKTFSGNLGLRILW